MNLLARKRMFAFVFNVKVVVTYVPESGCIGTIVGIVYT